MSCKNELLVVSRYKTSVEEDDAIIEDPHAGPRQKVAARLLRIEKSILKGTPQSRPRQGCHSTQAAHAADNTNCF